MNSFIENTDTAMDNNPVWGKWIANYNKYYLEYDGDRSPKIPKNIHFVWLGSLFPEKYKRLQKTWIKHHPEWNIKVWDDNDAENFGMLNKKAFDIIENYGAKSDIFRYEILYRYGGIYVDTDFECFKPFDDLLYLDFFAGTGWNVWPVVFNSILACVPGNIYLFNIINNIQQKQIDRPTYGFVEILNFTGCDFITDIYVKYLEAADDKAVIFPSKFFFPMPATIRLDVREDSEASRGIVDSYIKPNTYCAHLWYCSWQK